MAEIIISIVDKIGRKEGISDGIKFQNIHHESSFYDLYANKVGHYNDDNCTYDNNWKYIDKAKLEENLEISSEVDINDDKLEDIHNIGEADDLFLNHNIVNEENQVNHFGDYQYENQQNIVSAN